jgi:hypothetical protein
MRPFLSAFFLLNILFCLGQADSLRQQKNDWPGASAITLTRQQIERLPVVNLMELLNTAFAYTGGDPLFARDYIFVVNGFVTVNPNSINLSQIERIEFYPGNTPLTRGSLAAKGSFVITTTAAGNGFALASKTGAASAAESSLQALGYDRVESKQSGFFSYQELTYNYSRKRFYSSNAFSFTHNPAPTILHTANGGSQEEGFHDRRFRFSHFAGYKVSSKLRVDASFLYATQPQREFSIYTNATAGSKGSREQPVWPRRLSGHVSLDWKPAHNFQNRLWIEAGKDISDYEMNIDETFSGSPAYFFRSKGKYRATNYTVSNEAVWKAVQAPKFFLHPYALLRYRYLKDENSNASLSGTGNPPTVVTANTQKRDANGFAAAPGIRFGIGQWLKADAFLGYDYYKANPSSFTSVGLDKVWMPDANLEFNLLPIFNPSSLDKLNLSSHYFEFRTNQQLLNVLDVYNRFVPLQAGTTASAVDADDVGRRWVNAISFGLKERLDVKIGYLLEKKRVLILMNPIIGGPSYQWVLSGLTRTGWSFEMNTTLVKKEKTKWNLQTVAFEERLVPADGQFTQPGSPVLFSDKSLWRGSLRTELETGSFFLQASALFSFNNVRNGSSFGQKEYFSNHLQNFLLAGYRLPVRNKIISGAEVNVQARNLLFSKQENMMPVYRYVGVGFYLQFAGLK